MRIIDETKDLPLYRPESGIRSFRGGETEENELFAAVENVMDVYINDVFSMKLVCTPNLLPELVLGRLYTEGMISTVDEVETITVDAAGDCCKVTLNGEPGNRPLSPVTSIEWKPEWIYALAEQMEAVTPLFIATHAVHSCYLGRKGKTLCCCEDLGRHNAVDKAVGCALRDGVNLRECILFTSGRMPTDMAAKAVRAGVPVMASKTVPTDQGIRLAERYHLTLIAFARNNRMTVLTGKTKQNTE